MTVAYVVLGLVVVAGLMFVLSHNRFVAQRAGVEATWSGVDVQLQRRHDLIPNLVDTVRAYATHERTLLERVTSARAAAVAADEDPEVGLAELARREDALTAVAHRLLAVAEAYPQLQAAVGFRQLQRQLVETEDRIAASRRLYNIEVRGLNRRVEAVPSNLVASMFGFTRAEYFEMREPDEATPPTVQA